MFTRESFDAARKAAKQRESRLVNQLALVAVPLGFAQLLLIRWTDKNLDHRTGLQVEGGVFLLYMALVVVMLWRVVAGSRAVQIACPQCKRPLSGMSLRVAGATGRCEHCGGHVIDETPAS
jgi:hypothetical protein